MTDEGRWKRDDGRETRDEKADTFCCPSSYRSGRPSPIGLLRKVLQQPTTYNKQSEAQGSKRRAKDERRKAKGAGLKAQS